MENKARIQKVLSDQGILSRRRTEELIKEGRITVNGRPAQPGHPIDIRRDIVAIDGERIWFQKKKKNYYVMLHKPRGYVTTMSDEKGRRSVADLVADFPVRLYPVGRLDKDSEGLLLMTNDGDFANTLMHPANHIGKTYKMKKEKNRTAAPEGCCPVFCCAEYGASTCPEQGAGSQSGWSDALVVGILLAALEDDDAPAGEAILLQDMLHPAVL